MTTPRGQRKASYDDESDTDMLLNIKKLVRTDFGGTDQVAWVRRQFSARGICGAMLSDAAADVILKILKRQVEGCRMRINPRIDALIERRKRV